MKKTAILILLIAVIVAGATYYFYNRFTFQPKWYAPAEMNQEFLPDENTDNLQHELEHQLITEKSAKINDNQILPLMINQIEKKSRINVRQMIKAVQTTVEPDEIQMEMIVDVNQIPHNELPPPLENALAQITKLMPAPVLEELYVKLNLFPFKRDNSITFHPNSTVTIGKLEFTLAELEKKFGVNSQIPLNQLNFSDFELIKNAIILKQ